MMRYTWDEKKAAQNLRLHRIAFEDAVKIFEGPTLEQLARPVTVIYTDLDEQTRRIISAWKAEKHEQKAYFDHLVAQD